MKNRALGILLAAIFVNGCASPPPTEIRIPFNDIEILAGLKTDLVQFANLNGQLGGYTSLMIRYTLWEKPDRPSACILDIQKTELRRRGSAEILLSKPSEKQIMQRVPLGSSSPEAWGSAITELIGPSSPQLPEGEYDLTVEMSLPADCMGEAVVKREVLPLRQFRLVQR